MKFNEKDRNSLAYRLNEILMTATQEFANENQSETDVFTIMGAANIYIAGIMTNAPSKKTALETLAECYEIQQRLLVSTPDCFFGKGLLQNPELN